MIEASCHCGAVKISLASAPEKITECNCSVCHRYGALWAYYAPDNASVTCAEDARRGYTRGDREIEFFHCRTCGCLTHYESIEKTPDGVVAVNARMLPPESIADVARRKFDGANTWTFID